MDLNDEAKIRICAVIVTYNRSTLLSRCLRAVKDQTKKLDEIIVIDNASSDDTQSVVLNSFSDVNYIRLPENIGGAGGFYTGMKKAYDAGYDYIWLMDDDGFPGLQCLSALVEVVFKNKEYEYLAPLVLDQDEKKNLAFGLLKNGNKITTTNQAKSTANSLGVIEGVSNPFNGVLLSRKAIQKVGYPIKEFFIWGDEVDYERRIKKGKICFGTRVDAYFYHPVPQGRFTKLFFGLGTVSISGNNFLDFYRYRNQIYLSRKYGSLKRTIKFATRFFIHYSLFFILQERNLKGYRNFLKGFLAGFVFKPEIEYPKNLE